MSAVSDPPDTERETHRPSAHLWARLRSPAVTSAGAVLGLLILVVWLSDHVPYDAWGPMVAATALVLISALIIRRTAAFVDDPWLGRVLVLSLLVKLLAALVRHYVAFEVYSGAADASGYHHAGLAIQQHLRDGVLSLDGNGLDAFGTETRNVGVITGVIYTVLGGYRIVGFMAFAWLGWVGQVLFVRAFKIGMPAGDLRRYALLVLFLPSLMFWPASIGKESYMVLALGWTSLGVAHMLGPERRLGRGVLHLVGGITLTLQIRPHVTLLVMIAVAAALLARQPDRRTRTGMTSRLVVLLLLVPGLLITLNRLDDFFGVEKFRPVEIPGILSQVEANTEQGGSQFEARPVRSPGDLPQAVTSVLLRPYPWQVDNGPTALAGAETLLFVGLFIASWRRLARLPRLLITTPYLAYALSLTLAFILAFSNVANTGILARQRTQILPLMITILCLPSPRRSHSGHDSALPTPTDTMKIQSADTGAARP